MGARCVRLAFALVLALVAVRGFGQGPTAALAGNWRIERVIARGPKACWDEGRARELVGSPLRYGRGEMEWKGGKVAVAETLSRVLSKADFAKEYRLELGVLGIAAARVTEVDLQHEDADVTGSTTEIPGDTVLLAGPRRIIVSACGVYYSAVRMVR